MLRRLKRPTFRRKCFPLCPWRILASFFISFITPGRNGGFPGAFLLLAASGERRGRDKNRATGFHVRLRIGNATKSDRRKRPRAEGGGHPGGQGQGRAEEGLSGSAGTVQGAHGGAHARSERPAEERAGLPGDAAAARAAAATAAAAGRCACAERGRAARSRRGSGRGNVAVRLLDRDSCDWDRGHSVPAAWLGGHWANRRGLAMN